MAMDIKSKFAAIRIRHIQVLFMFLLLTIGVGMRVQFSVALVAMTDETASKNPNIPVYDWDNKSILLSSFFWGYSALQIIAAMLSRIYGSKSFLIGAMAINSMACCLIPLAAEYLGANGVMISRAVMGLSQGFFYPSVYNILAHWIPPSERAQMGSSALAGGSFGIITGMPITGFISASWAGWSYSFYFYGTLGFLWIIGYYYLGASTPATHPNISKMEQAFIENQMDMNGAELKVPWKAIVTSPAFWAIFVAYIGQTWGFQTILSELPIYMNKVMKFNMETNGLLSAAPYLTMCLIIFLSGYLADFLINKNYLMVEQARRIFSFFASFVPATALVVLSFLPEDYITLCVVMIIIAIGLQGASSAGFEINHIDLSPNFAGVLMAICNSCGEVFSNLGPLTVHFIVTDETNKAQWRIIFLAAATSYIVSCGIFLTYMRADIQPWNNVNNIVKENENDKNERYIVNKIV
ncbi:unnamed protein product [Psylliodes chrysocephalus]|uniref:Major facilitator superfamily (MFS) profile domain-containing protein n=1 Tax=Psylliodes chrysocephalus TaxID=3402493 RepID=A0A9P0G6Q0_9CUCU|nr:unnamed protein product [Psylliodes chrysocephala]